MSNHQYCSAETELSPGQRLVSDLLAKRGTKINLPTDSLLFLDGDPLDTLYEVRRGVVRCFTVAEDGQKHIFDFASYGALIGLGAALQWHFTAEAVGPVSLRVLPRHVFASAMAANPALAEWRARMVDAVIQSREQQLLTMASRSAEERLLIFLYRFAETAGPDLKRSNGTTALPMSRRDIADHLGISFETVSRSFSALKRRGKLELIGPGVFRLPVPIEASLLTRSPAMAESSRAEVV
ncbi:MAG: Crp/Fnr family transcriptional regulator [Pseudomonadota bacterium]